MIITFISLSPKVSNMRLLSNRKIKSKRTVGASIRYISENFSLYSQIMPFFCVSNTFGSSHRKCSMEIGVLKNFTLFTGKHLCLFNKVAGLL